ncbi:TPA: glycosyltransferase family 2 protein [Proteus mirabilis]|uniref:glycosyltransferase family 2 protein n=3 Tax=Proteus mirabilis TaxID=584 RepID=UPI0003843506|nr:glycosyltransferase family 2 protein [Proteus mirabilis]AGS61648.1 glycosyl transferase [Proteus mirabilis BB2000]EKW7427487.1 glycosyltransferase family 2 protein [Proteus mirabilis]ELB1231539.1 glycosyltransferase family 2 protein [Proteus mirabilis]MCL8580737.1 glycosyltransferase [Proteus mirabilis]MCL8591903.1 glycosyltransferase [Proteus mirabilis]
MDENIKFSIIVPIFNAQEFILDTLSSISNQTYKNFEVLLVDDGSTDNTREIISEFTQNDHRFKILYQNNSGPNIARNYAMKFSTGEYFVYLDSDDIFLNNLLYTLHAEISKKKYDIINFGYEFKNFVENKTISKSNYKRHELYKEDILLSSFLSKGISGVCWNKCIKKQLIMNNKIFFLPDKMHGRDILFSRTCAYYADIALVIPEILIISRFRQGSYSRSFSKKNILSAIDLIKQQELFFNSKLSNDQMNFLYMALQRHIRYICVLNAFRTKSFSEYILNYNLLSNYFNYKLNKNNGTKINFKYRILDLMLKYPRSFRIICKIVKKFGVEPY